VGFLRVFLFYLLATTTTKDPYKLTNPIRKETNLCRWLWSYAPENEATRYYTEYWKLKLLYKLHSICLDHSFKYVDLSRSINALQFGNRISFWICLSNIQKFTMNWYYTLLLITQDISIMIVWSSLQLSKNFSLLCFDKFYEEKMLCLCTESLYG
jgi:hypothetical protein